MTDITVYSTGYQSEKRSWYLGTADQPGYTIGGTLDVSAFTAATHYPNGYIKSGTPLAKVSGLMVPYDSLEATTTGAGVLAGHLYTDQRVVSSAATADFPIPLLDHGRVKAAKVPQGLNAFTVPVAAAKRAATDIVYI